ncbi:peptidase inhibitor family I36 protein [Streptomyces sp. ND04-05B]|uniref:peptidase inhibitor family I36 protein n=1 Tax=Streptomyces sp. ND04-05B TaxID=3028693 RepID=UPI0029AA8AB4|nr:peptidase inhibitor family I36 protein [Streptomyces sp. ND04-05B]MDX3069447.1 peptidase inhibitor family I36 protein [Streptomyces sp. ND04-05B]
MGGLLLTPTPRRRPAALALTAASAAVLSIIPTQAHAAGGANGCISNAATPSTAFCFFYNSNLAGSYAGMAPRQASLAGHRFSYVGTTNAGIGQNVMNNSASVYNNNSSCVRIYFNSNFAGPSDTVSARSGRNLSNTYNNNASSLPC